MMTPPFGYRAPESRDPQSPYFRGRYYPPDAPEFFTQQTRVPERFRYLYLDPRFRLPLFQVAFHDAVITTHHWSVGTLKFTDQLSIRTLLEALYTVPPLYHMTVAEFTKHRRWMQEHYRFFSPLHRELVLEPMTDFTWLTPDRLVQRTMFGDGSSIIANFGTQPYQHGDHAIAATSVLAIRSDGAITRYRP